MLSCSSAIPVVLDGEGNDLMRVQLADNEDVWLTFCGVEYLIPADWVGEHEIVSECGWWIGKVFIVQNENGRFIDWIAAYSLRFDDE